MPSLDPQTTVLVLIDLQQGIVPLAKAPYDGAAVLRQARRLADAFRGRKALVVRVKVGWSADGADRLKQPSDQPNAGGDLPANWLDDPAQLPSEPGDLPILKRQWNAFHGTELDLQLRRRGIRTIVIGGISTPFGVEGTARAAWELGYELVFPEDLSSAGDEAVHRNSMEKILPRMGRVRTVDEVLKDLGPA